MSITRSEAARLLTLASSWDSRNVGEAAAMAWYESGSIGRWTYDEACEAIKYYYTTTTDQKPWVMPSHVTAHIREHRQDRAMREEAAALTGPPDPRVLDAVRDFADRRAIPPADGGSRSRAVRAALDSVPAPRPVEGSPLSPEQVRAAKRVPCPWCQARPFHECVRPGPGGGRRQVTPHPSRVEAAEAAAGGAA